MTRQSKLTSILIIAILMTSLTSIGGEGIIQAQDHLSTLHHRDSGSQHVDLDPAAGHQAPGPVPVLPADTLDPATLQASDWWATAQDDIRQSEYHVTWQDQTYLPDLPAAYQAPNRAHNLRTYFTPAGIRVIPRTNTTPTWEWGLTLTGHGYAGSVQPVAAAELAASANRIEYHRGALTEWYINDERGLEQGFTLDSPPVPLSFGHLVLELALTGDLTPNLTDDGTAIEFTTPGGVRVLCYSDLYAADATGRGLPAHFSLSPVSISIWVDDSAAVYPITIDPLATTPSWTAEINQVSAQFGFSVSTAGDVNGDGYADVIVGVPLYDHSEANEGGAFVYHGSAVGLSTSFDWWAESRQNGAQLGFSVGTAGDVNGDGYADVIVGAPLYDNGETNEGSAFVWLGSESGLGATGTPTNADWSAQSDQAGAYLGWSVGTAGDVNGDDYDDVIIGANQYDSGPSQGRAFVWYGDSSGLGDDGTPANPDWWAESGSASQFAWSVGTAGDVNGDGYADVIVGAPLYSNGQSSEGGAFVWHGSDIGLGANGTSANADWTAEINQADAQFGYSVGTAGDVNGDGYADVIVGAPFYNHGETEEGLAFVYHGSALGLNTSFDWWAESHQNGARLGDSVGTAGDVNGDGYADVIVGADWYTNPETSEGQAFVWFGSESGLGATGTPTNADWSAGSDQASARLGISVGTAGDVNGDGYADVIVGAFLYDNGQTDEGRAYVYHGSAAGLSTAAAWTAESDQASSYFGLSVGTAGDVNGDGYADVIVGAVGYDNGQTGEGRTYVYHGSAAGLSTTANWTAEGDQANAQFGVSVGTAGDVNGDGYADVIVGANLYDNGQTDEGQAFVYYGSASGLNATADWTAESDQSGAHLGFPVGMAGDVNGDGYADVIVGATCYDSGQADEGRAFVYHGSSTGLTTGSADWTAESDQAQTHFGWSVGTAGDVNGDGYTDVIVGAPDYDNGQESEGRAFVYHGSAAGLSATVDWTAESDQANADFGVSVNTAGDVNGDGYADIIVGAHYYDNGQTDEGQAFVYYGSALGLSATADWTAESDQADAQFGVSVDTAGDVNGDGYADIIVGAHYYDNGQTDEGRAFVYHGSSTGLTTGSAEWTAESDQASAWFGWSVGTAGDVNGDGYADVIVGAPYYDNDQTGEGRAFVYYGNSGAGLALTPRQLRTDGSAPIAPLGMSDSATAMQLRLTGRTPLGREKVKLQWQVAPLGTSFNATTVISGTSVDWTDTMTTGVVIAQNVTGLTADTPYHWRVRLLYRPGNRLGQSASRWLTIPWNGWTEQDFRTPEPIAGLAATNDSPTPLRRATTLTATVTAGSNMAYTWAFGDGDTGSGAVVPHTYPAAGVYTAIVTASNSVSVVTATTTITVEEPITEQATWTFILYFAGDNNLCPYLERAIDKMERVANKPNMDILVLWDSWQSSDTQLYHVQYDTASGIVSPIISVGWNPGELNTGNAQTLVDFVNWARTTYPADYYFLSIADHGRGTTGIAWDDTSGKDNLSAYAELESALDAITSAGGEIDVLYFDACLMAMIEDAYEVRDDVDYIVASENLGWSVFAYDAYVSSVTDNTTPLQLAQNVADAYIAALRRNRAFAQWIYYPGTVSALDMSAIESVGNAADGLAQALETYLDGTNVSQMITIRNNVQTFDSQDYQILDSTDEYIDLYHFAELVQVSISDGMVQNSAGSVMDKIDDCVVAEHHRSGWDPWSGNYWDLDDAHGIAVYFPPQSGGWDYMNYVTGGSWAFCTTTAWDDFLVSYFALSGLPPETPTYPGMPPMPPIHERIFLPLVLRGG